MNLNGSGPGVAIRLEQFGPSYVVDIPDLDARLTFRDVRVDRELSADVSVNVADVHVLRTTTSLALVGRDRLARTIGELARNASGDLWRRAVFAASEAVLEAEEQLGSTVDLRTAPALVDRNLYVAEPLGLQGASAVVAPSEAGKSTIVRAIGLSVASGIEIIPGIRPTTPGPVLYIAGEDPVAAWHARSLDAVAVGAGIDRRKVPYPIRLQDVRGRKLHRIGRAIAEMAADHVLVIIDSQQSLLPSADAAGGGVRDRDCLFFDAIDAIARPVLIVSHPNLTGARRWEEADGRVAGSEVNRDRLRMSWRATWKDEPAVVGTSFRRFTLTCTKFNHGPRPAPIGFGVGWTFGDPGVVTFSPASPMTLVRDGLSSELEDALIAYKAGATTPTPLAKALNIKPDTAKSRLRLLRERGLLEAVTDNV
jgi:hypothetical protein